MILCVESSDTSVVTDGNLMSPEELVLKILESQIVHTQGGSDEFEGFSSELS